jgi:DNA modification methylase
MQEKLFVSLTKYPKLQTEYNENNFNPQLISFRELVPEIVSTSYLTHSIYYYPAKFIPQVVRYCIDNYTKQNDWVIDPFAGSGTVALEANLTKRNAILLDINYLLNHIIPIKIPQDKTKLENSILNEKLGQVFDNETKFTPAWSNLEYWYPSEILELLKKYWAGQKKLENDLYSMIIQSALVKVSKQFSYAEHKTPKLFKSKFKNQFITDLLAKDWKTELIFTIRNLSIETLKNINQYCQKTINNTNEVKYFGGVDSANYKLEDNIEIDCIITSPPYLQAQEYIRTFKLDLYWLGYTEAQVKGISNLEIPYRKADKLIETETLNKIREQLKIKKLTDVLNSYFCYTIKALENATMNLKKGGLACIFVGNPKVDGIEVETWRIINEYFAEKGFQFRAIYEDRIKTRQLFGSRNNKNPEGMKSEYLLVIEK